MLFTDIVGSTQRLGDLGDAAWAELLARHHGAIRSVLVAHGGREVGTTGDGFLASFDAPASAIRAAVAAVDAVAMLGVEIRAGLHTGEVELGRDGMAGLGVHLAARVMARAEGGQVLVSSTVRELMAGSRFGFTDLGLHELKGFAEKWRLFALDPATVWAVVDEPASVGEPYAPVPVGEYGVKAGGLPPALMRASRRTLIGRQPELDRLARARRWYRPGWCSSRVRRGWAKPAWPRRRPRRRRPRRRRGDLRPLR